MIEFSIEKAQLWAGDGQEFGGGSKSLCAGKSTSGLKCLQPQVSTAHDWKAMIALKGTKWSNIANPYQAMS